jgi:hypothetical protein
MPKLNAEKIKFWIQESYIENPNWCVKCKIRPEGWEIKWKVGKKGRTMINETLMFDDYITELLWEEPFSKEHIKETLLSIRPKIKQGEKWYIDNEKQHFFSLYQDALFKSILPINVYEALHPWQKRPNSISMLEALTYWHN